MSIQQISEYIKKARNKSKSDSTITDELETVGWSTEQIKAGFLLIDNPDIPIPSSDVKAASRPQRDILIPGDAGNPGGMWDAFEHILMFISLYVLAGSLTFMLQYFVDRWIPRFNPYDYGYNNYSNNTSALRSYISALIVSTPLFVFFYLRITKKTEHTPDLRHLPARKFLIYLTLVVTFIIEVISVIVLVYEFISGNVTMNFFLKLLIILAVSGAIFGYYLNQVKEDRKMYS